MSLCRTQLHPPTCTAWWCHMPGTLQGQHNSGRLASTPGVTAILESPCHLASNDTKRVGDVRWQTRRAATGPAVAYAGSSKHTCRRQNMREARIMPRSHTCLYGGEEAGGVLHQVGEDEFKPQVVELCQDVKSLGAACSVEAAVQYCAVRWCAVRWCAARGSGCLQDNPRLERSCESCSCGSGGTCCAAAAPEGSWAAQPVAA